MFHSLQFSASRAGTFSILKVDPSLTSTCIQELILGMWFSLKYLQVFHGVNGQMAACHFFPVSSPSFTIHLRQNNFVYSQAIFYFHNSANVLLLCTSLPAGITHVANGLHLCHWDLLHALLLSMYYQMLIWNVLFLSLKVLRATWFGLAIRSRNECWHGWFSGWKRTSHYVCKINQQWKTELYSMYNVVNLKKCYLCILSQ